MIVEMPGRPDLGTRDVLFSRVAGNNFEHHGTEFSLVGDWRLTVTLEEPGLPPLTQEITHTFGAEPPGRDVPGIPWRFDPMGGIGAVLLLLVGIGGVVAAAYAGRTPLRKEAGGLGLAALALGIVILLQARYDPILAVGGEAGTINENDLAMVARGELVYTDACLSCHGAGLRGDGPDAAGLQPPPADFSAPHTYVHSDENLVYWVKNGKQGTAMPGFDNDLTDQEIRDVLAYIKHEQQALGEETAIVPAEACVVGEMSFADITGAFNHSIHPEILRETPLVEAVDPEVDSATQDEVLFTLEQLVACTNSGNTLRRLPLFTDAQLKDMFPMGMDARLTMMTTTAPVPLGEGEQVGLQDAQRVRWLADGRIAVNVVISDPAGIGVSLDDEYPVISQATFVLLWDPDVGVWLIDEIR
jgi:cytochrome c553